MGARSIVKAVFLVALLLLLAGMAYLQLRPTEPKAGKKPTPHAPDSPEATTPARRDLVVAAPTPDAPEQPTPSPEAESPQEEDEKRSAEEILADPALAQEYLDKYLYEYATLLGEDFEKYPLLEWRDELEEMTAYYEETLPQRRVEKELRDNLTDAERKEFSRMRDLYARCEAGRLTGDEPEFLLASRELLSTYDGTPEDIAAMLLDTWQAGAAEAAEELQRTLAQTTLPEALVVAAEIDGRLEARQALLEAALSQVESPETARLGHRIQVLRRSLNISQDHSALLRGEF